ncbi:hypothetical protein ACT2CR_00425 [Candidatus Vidania fulgoroideorum]
MILKINNNKLLLLSNSIKNNIYFVNKYCLYKNINIKIYKFNIKNYVERNLICYLYGLTFF